MSKIIVIGGGIIGSLSAYELAKAGHSVLVLERSHVGAGASGSSAALLEFQLDAHRNEPFFSLAQASHDLFPDLHRELLEETGIDIQFERCGIAQLAMDATDAAVLTSEAKRLSSLGLNVEWWDTDDVERKLPALGHVHYGAIFFKDDGQVSGEKFLQAALLAAKKAGVNLRENVGDLTLKKTDKDVVLASKTEEFNADAYVLAAGAWSDQVLAPLGVKLGVEPIRGQLLVYDSPRSVLPFPVYTQRNGYLTPKQDNYLLAGTTVEQAGFDSTTTEAGRASIVQNCGALLPKLAQAKARSSSAGLRPKSPDELPILGFLPGFPSVFVATGHYRNGILLAPITAKIVAAALSQTTSPVATAPFSPERFS